MFCLVVESLMKPIDMVPKKRILRIRISDLFSSLYNEETAAWEKMNLPKTTTLNQLG